MEDPNVLERMRSDWNDRAGEDANYYVAFGRREQDDEEFFSTGSDIVKSLELDLKRFRGRDAALEIGCGPGRLMRPMSRNFSEIHGVDVSDEMIRLARERLRDTPTAHPHHSSGSDLAMFPDEKPEKLDAWCTKFARLFTQSIYKWVQAPLSLHIGNLDLERERALQLPVVERSEWQTR